MTRLRIQAYATPKGYAARHGLSVTAVYRLIHRGPLKAIRVGRRLRILEGR